MFLPRDNGILCDSMGPGPSPTHPPPSLGSELGAAIQAPGQGQCRMVPPGCLKVTGTLAFPPILHVLPALHSRAEQDLWAGNDLCREPKSETLGLSQEPGK